MADLYNILPLAILYLTSGFSFLSGYYMCIDRRFDFMSDISFSIMLVVGYLLDTIARVIPCNFGFTDEMVRNVILVCISFARGMIIAIIRNKLGNRVSKFIIRHGRRKTSSERFWYDILDEKDKPLWVRLTNNEKEYCLVGVLLSLSEMEENPYLLLGYCTKYNLKGKILDGADSDNECVQTIVRPDSFDEITILYDDDSLKVTKLNILD